VPWRGRTTRYVSVHHPSCSAPVHHAWGYSLKPLSRLQEAAYKGTRGEALKRTLKSGAFASGVLILCYQVRN
jgi:hypothetical protein